MHSTEIACLLGAVMLMPIAIESHQDHVSGHQNGASVMGFDQDRTAHHFSLYADGGAIEVVVKDPTDAGSRDAIRSHLRHIAVMFADGDFDAPMMVHDPSNVPGTKVMTSLKGRIRYAYADESGGGRVNIVTTDSSAIDAVHKFLKFQIEEHKTGDSTAVRPR